MKTLHFEGSSDDTFGMTQTSYADDFDNCGSGKPIEWMLQDHITGDAMIVVGQHAPGQAGGWLIGVAPYDSEQEEKAIPEWPMRIERGGRPYSPRLVIEVPDNVVPVCLQRESSED